MKTEETQIVSFRNINKKIYKDFKKAAVDWEMSLQEAVNIAMQNFVKKGDKKG